MTAVDLVFFEPVGQDVGAALDPVGHIIIEQTGAFEPAAVRLERQRLAQDACQIALDIFRNKINVFVHDIDFVHIACFGQPDELVPGFELERFIHGHVRVAVFRVR